MPRFLAHPGIPPRLRRGPHVSLGQRHLGGAAGGFHRLRLLFVLFGALLDKAGAAEYFVQVAVAMLGRFRGGPAKAAVLASGLTGMVSGSSIANVATTGTFTIPLMKRVGLPDYKAGAVEVAASNQRAAPASGHGPRPSLWPSSWGCRTSTSSPRRRFRRCCRISRCFMWSTWKRSSWISRPCRKRICRDSGPRSSREFTSSFPFWR